MSQVSLSLSAKYHNSTNDEDTHYIEGTLDMTLDQLAFAAERWLNIQMMEAGRRGRNYIILNGERIKIKNLLNVNLG